MLAYIVNALVGLAFIFLSVSGLALFVSRLNHHVAVKYGDYEDEAAKVLLWLDNRDQWALPLWWAFVASTGVWVFLTYVIFIAHIWMPVNTPLALVVWPTLTVLLPLWFYRGIFSKRTKPEAATDLVLSLKFRLALIYFVMGNRGTDVVYVLCTVMSIFALAGVASF